MALELFRKRAQNQSELYSYKSKQQQEVDFVIKKGLNIVQLIQVSYSLKDEKTKKRELSALLKAGKDLKCKNLLIITWDYAGEEEINTNRIIYIPLWKWLLEKQDQNI